MDELLPGSASSRASTTILPATVSRSSLILDTPHLNTISILKTGTNTDSGEGFGSSVARLVMSKRHGRNPFRRLRPMMEGQVLSTELRDGGIKSVIGYPHGERGTKREEKFIVVDLSKALMSVSELVDARHRVIFDGRHRRAELYTVRRAFR